MIHLITGTPGAGKTLLAVEHILKNAKADSVRPLYSNINGLALDELRCFDLENPIEWFKYPEGSIIVIDECQRFFPPRPSGSKVPETVSMFETHRHQGLDIILITQGPTLIDQNIRKLCDRHQHCYRPFGKKQRTVFEWTGCNDYPEPSKSESNSLKTKMKFDPELFKFYKSSSMHTDKDRTPWVKIILPFVFVVISLSLFAFMFYRLTPEETKKVETKKGSLALTVPLYTYAGFFGSDGIITVLVKDQTGSFLRLDYDRWHISGSDVSFYRTDEKTPFARVNSSILAKLLQE